MSVTTEQLQNLAGALRLWGLIITFLGLTIGAAGHLVAQKLLSSQRMDKKRSDERAEKARRRIQTLDLRLSIEFETDSAPVSGRDVIIGPMSNIALVITRDDVHQFANAGRSSRRQISETRHLIEVAYEPIKPHAILGRPVDDLAAVNVVAMQINQFKMPKMAGNATLVLTILVNGLPLLSERILNVPPEQIAQKELTLNGQTLFAKISQRFDEELVKRDEVAKRDEAANVKPK